MDPRPEFDPDCYSVEKSEGHADTDQDHTGAKKGHSCSKAFDTLVSIKRDRCGIPLLAEQVHSAQRPHRAGAAKGLSTSSRLPLPRPFKYEPGLIMAEKASCHRPRAIFSNWTPMRRNWIAAEIVRTPRAVVGHRTLGTSPGEAARAGKSRRYAIVLVAAHRCISGVAVGLHAARSRYL